MNAKNKKLVIQMIINTMVGDKKRVRQLHREYRWENRLRVTIREYTEWRQKVA